MDMEFGIRNNPEVEVGKAAADMSERFKPSSSYRSQGRSGIPLGLQIKKAEFLRRGSPKLCKSSSRISHSKNQRSGTEKSSGPGKSSKGSSRRNMGLEGSKKPSGNHP